MLNGKVLVHLRAPVMTQSGYGAHSREVLEYLLSDDRFIVALEATNWGHCGFLHKKDFRDEETFHKYRRCMVTYENVNGKHPYDISLQVTIPNEFQRRAQVNIGVTAGIEVDRPTKVWIEKCNEMDIIVVPSQHSAQVLAGVGYNVQGPDGNIQRIQMTKPVFIIPQYYNKPEEVKPLDIKFSTKRNLLHVGQWGSKGGFGEDRKNIGDMIKMFLHTFKDKKDVGLVLKVQAVNGCVADRMEVEKRLKQIKANFPNAKCKIHLLHSDLKDEEMWGLYSHPQILGLLSLTHGEGFGRPLLEAASCGKPVLATNWSGHLDFLRERSGFIPFEYEMVEIPDCQVWENVIDKGSRWAKVNDKDVIKKMKKFIDGPKRIQKDAEKHLSFLKENFSQEAAFKVWKEMFDSFIRTKDNTPNEKGELPSPKDPQKLAAIDYLERDIDKESDKKRVLFIMPQSAGDCLMSTAVIKSLILRRHPDTDHDWYVATKESFVPLFDALVEDFGVKMINYEPNLMLNSEVLREVFDYVYNPGVNIQFTFSNWLLGNGEYSVRLIEEIAKNCNLYPKDMTNYHVKVEECEVPEGDYLVIHPGGQKSAKTYRYWPDIVHNLKNMLPDTTIVQVGTTDENLVEGAEDYRGKTFAESFHVIKNARFLVGVDSFPAHAAAAMETPHLVLYGSTHANSCAPVMLRKKVPQLAIETDVCEPRCYKDQCMKSLNGEKNCLSHISASTVCNSIYSLVNKILEEDNADGD